MCSILLYLYNRLLFWNLFAFAFFKYLVYNLHSVWPHFACTYSLVLLHKFSHLFIYFFNKYLSFQISIFLRIRIIYICRVCKITFVNLYFHFCNIYIIFACCEYRTSTSLLPFRRAKIGDRGSQKKHTRAHYTIHTYTRTDSLRVVCPMTLL